MEHKNLKAKIRILKEATKEVYKYLERCIRIKEEGDIDRIVREFIEKDIIRRDN